MTNGDDRAHRRIDPVSNVTDVSTDGDTNVAMDIGPNRLVPDNGPDPLIETMDNHVSSFKDDETREVFHAGTNKTSGVLTPQHG